VIRLPAGWPSGQEFFLRHHARTVSGAHPASYPMVTVGTYPGAWSDQSPPSSAEVKNAWSYTSTTPVRYMRGA